MTAYLLGHDRATIVTDAATGKVSVLPGIPITVFPSSAAAQTLLYTDADAFFAPTVTALGAPLSLLPALFSDSDSIYAADSDLVGGHSPTKHVRPGRVSDSDSIFAASIVSARLFPGLVAAADAIASASVDNRNILRPALLAADDAVSSFRTTRVVQPDLVASDDAVPAADVGWQVIADTTTDTDAIYSDIAIHFVVLADVFLDEEHIDTYPFFVQAVSGGVPIPPPSNVLTGSFARRRTLTGSIKRSPHLTGSITYRTGRRGGEGVSIVTRAARRDLERATGREVRATRPAT